MKGPEAGAVQRLELRHPGGTTRLVIGEGALDAARRELESWLSGRPVFVLTSDAVGSLHAAALEPLRAGADRWTTLRVPDGERAKEPAVAERLWSRMLESGGRRDTRILALGGGTVGDLAGFVAGCFLRGVEYAQLPTTLLAQVDAAIGGKTGINLPRAKNSVGLFHHPRLVVADTRFLATLPPAELRSGLLEVVKMAALLDLELLARLERDLERLLRGEIAALAPVVAAAARAKLGVVERDPAELGGERRVLNFGHTLGHAIEAALEYRRLRHGEAVAYGMLFALRLAERRGLELDGAERLRALIRRCRLPALPPLEAEKLLEIMRSDKKAARGGLVWVLPSRLGEGRAVEGVSEDEVRTELAAFLAARGEV